MSSVEYAQEAEMPSKQQIHTIIKLTFKIQCLLTFVPQHVAAFDLCTAML